MKMALRLFRVNHDVGGAALVGVTVSSDNLRIKNYVLDGNLRYDEPKKPRHRLMDHKEFYQRSGHGIIARNYYFGKYSSIHKTTITSKIRRFKINNTNEGSETFGLKSKLYRLKYDIFENLREYDMLNNSIQLITAADLLMIRGITGSLPIYEHMGIYCCNPSGKSSELKINSDKLPDYIDAISKYINSPELTQNGNISIESHVGDNSDVAIINIYILRSLNDDPRSSNDDPRSSNVVPNNLNNCRVTGMLTMTVYSDNVTFETIISTRLSDADTRDMVDTISTGIHDISSEYSIVDLRH